MKRFSIVVGGWLRLRAVPVMWTVLGLASAAVGAFTLGVTIGFFGLALLMFVMEWRVRS